MCWESNSRAIIMLTRCVEKGREKCDHYWPYDTMPVYYGDISVQILNETRYPDWNISEFMVCRVSIDIKTPNVLELQVLLDSEVIRAVKLNSQMSLILYLTVW